MPWPDPDYISEQPGLMGKRGEAASHTTRFKFREVEFSKLDRNFAINKIT